MSFSKTFRPLSKSVLSANYYRDVTRNHHSKPRLIKTHSFKPPREVCLVKGVKLKPPLTIERSPNCIDWIEIAKIGNVHQQLPGFGRKEAVYEKILDFMPVSQIADEIKCRRKKSDGSDCHPCVDDGSDGCKAQHCRLKKPKRKRGPCDPPEEPEDICKKENPCSRWYPGKKPCE